MVWGFLGAIAGGLFAGASSRRTNAANVAQSKWATRFNAREARMAEKRAWQRHMYDRHYNDPAQQRARMEKAGFNPLLSINAGNVQSNVASQTGSAVFTPLQDNGAAIGNMIAGGFASLDSMKMQQQQIDLAKTEIEFQKQQLQDQSYKMSMTPRAGGLYGADYDRSTIRKPSSASDTRLPENVRVDDAGWFYTDDNVGDRGIVFAGANVEQSPYFSDAEEYERRYGELGGSAMGFVNVAADAVSTFYTNSKHAYRTIFPKNPSKHAYRTRERQGVVGATDGYRPKPTPMGSMSDPSNYWFYQNQWGE